MIYIDFDGTIVDVWQRYYQVYLCASGIDDFLLSIDDYKKYKFQYQNDEKIAEALGRKLLSSFKEKKRSLLEAEQFLKLDKLLLDEQHLTLLKGLTENDAVRILTIRKNREQYSRGLKTLGLEWLENITVVLIPDIDSSLIKYEFIKRNHKKGDKDYIIGDSQIDMNASQLSYCQAIFVETGLFCVENIRTRNYVLANNINQALDSILKPIIGC